MKANKKTSKEKEDATLRSFLALVMADIDIFLLKEENQEKDKNKLYTKEEIRNQLHDTYEKFTNLPMVNDAIYDIPLFSTLSEKLLINMGYTQAEINKYKKQI